MKISVEFKGTEKVMKALQALGERAQKAMGAALYQEGNDILRAAKIITPVKTGVLKGSGFVGMPQYSGASVTVDIGFGGAASAYAVIQHEELDYKHTPPTQAKYLEQPFMAAAKNGMGQRIANKLQKELK